MLMLISCVYQLRATGSSSNDRSRRANQR